MVPPNATTINTTANRRYTKPRENKVERPTVTRYFDPGMIKHIKLHYVGVIRTSYFTQI